MGKDGRDGLDGADGRDGKDVDPAAVQLLVSKAVEAALKSLPGPRDGRDGKDAAFAKETTPRTFRVEVVRTEFQIPGVGTLPLATELIIRPV